MSNTSFDPNDPRLTAWLLGELSPSERTEFTTFLDLHPEARAEIESLRCASEFLRTSLATAPPPALDPAAREVILTAARTASGWSNSETVQLSGRDQAAAGPAAAPQRKRAWAPVVAMATVACSVLALVTTLQFGDTAVKQSESESIRMSSFSEPGREVRLRGIHTLSLPPGRADALDGLQATDESGRRRLGRVSRQAGRSVATGLAQESPVDISVANRSLVDSEIREVDELTELISPEFETSPRGALAHSIESPVSVLTAREVARQKVSRGAQTLLGKKIQNDFLEEQDQESKTSPAASTAAVAGLEKRSESYLFRFVPSHATAAASPATEEYAAFADNRFQTPQNSPLSTFGVDVDTASYANVRRFLSGGQLPPPEAVRIEELLNYFRCDDPAPAGEVPFSVTVESGPCPWKTGHSLVRIGLAGREIPMNERPTANLVFLVDVSGSMQPENKLPLVKHGLKLLARQLTASDRLAIVTYSDTARVVLPSTQLLEPAQIEAIIDSLQAGGSTNGAGGIQLAYNEAIHHFIDKGVNRVVLCTDGDFNVGTTGDDDLVKLIEDRRRSQVYFSVYGFGMGNLKDGKLEKLADHGNGHYGYIDGPQEAQKAFVEDAEANLVTIAQDVKIQVEFNPAQVGAYRLIGYENRVLAAADFRNDQVDAGDIGAGHRVTALYEIVPPAALAALEGKAGLRYAQAPAVAVDGETAGELLTVRLRYKAPGEETSREIETPYVSRSGNASSRDLQWSAAVAAFGMILRHSPARGDASTSLVLELANAGLREDSRGHRREFIQLVEQAARLLPQTSPTPERPQQDSPSATTLTAEQAQAVASCSGKYSNLLRVLDSNGDQAIYGSVFDFGAWDGREYQGHTSLPRGFWVYVAPKWYIWGERSK